MHWPLVTATATPRFAKRPAQRRERLWVEPSVSVPVSVSPLVALVPLVRDLALLSMTVRWSTAMHCSPMGLIGLLVVLLAPRSPVRARLFVYRE
jgi:hypothetical protein